MMNSKNVTPVGTGKTTYSNEGKQQLSSGLKERLKRCGRYHCTPPSAKRPCLSSQRELSTHILNESPTVNTDKPINSKRETVGLGNDTTPKPLKSCTRKVNTSLSFLSPILKPVINNIKGVSSNADSPNSPLPEALVCSESLTASTLFQSSKPVVNNCKKAAPSNFSPSSPLPEARVSSESLSASPLPDVGEAGTPLSSKLSQGGRRICVRNKNKLFDGDCDGSGEDEVIHRRRELRDLKSSLAIKEEKLRKLNMVKMYRSKNNLEELQRLIDKWRTVSQDSITDLHQLLPEPRPSLGDFLNHLQVDKDLVQIQLEDD